MVKLGVLKIENLDSIIEVRKKIRRIVAGLGFTEIKATRIETAISELSRKCFNYDKEIKIYIYLTDINHQNAILFKLLKLFTKDNLAFGDLFFDKYSVENNLDGSINVEAFSCFENNSLDISESLIDEIKKELASLSRKELLYELKKKNNVLLLQAKELRSAKMKAEEAAKAKSDFLANMSHEIRTPMNAVIGMTHLIKKTELTSKQRDYIDKISRSSQHLLSVINDILDYSKIESGMFRIEETNFNLNTVLDNLDNLVGEKCFEKGLRLIFDVDAELPNNFRGDPLRLGQILINYVNNAIKFTEKGEIVVRIFKEKEARNVCVVRFEVEDTGIGMTKDQCSKLFQSFQQGDTSITRKYGGTGLGLAISKRLANLMEGNVGVEAQYGKGSKFWFTAKLGVNNSSEKITYSRKNLKIDSLKAISGANILLVEDNELNVQVIIELLEEGEFIIDIAENGKKALEKINKNKYDLVLMDMQMPVMDGVTATKEIRKDSRYSLLPIIAITANAMYSDRHKCINAGMNDYIVKPIDSNELFSVLLKWIPQKNIEIIQSKQQEIARVSSFEKIDILVPGLDTAAGLSRVLGKKNSYIRLLQKYVDGHKNTFRELHKMFLEDDWIGAERTVHTLKSVSGSIGAIIIQEKAAKLEDAIRMHTSFQILKPMINEIDIMLTKLIDYLEEILPKEKEEINKGSISTEEELKDFLIKLKPHLETRKPKKCNEVIEDCRKLVWPIEMRCKAENINKLVTKYKFKEALDIVEALLRNFKEEI